MNRSAEEVRREIEATRVDLERSIVALQSNLTEATDWRVWVRRRPVAICGAAFGLGLLIGWR